MYCSQCGAKIPENARFCPACGFKILTETYMSASDTTHTDTLYASKGMQVPEEEKIFAQNLIALDAKTLIHTIENRALRKLQISSDYHEYFHPCCNLKGKSEQQQFDKIRQLYHQVERNKELFLFFYDNTFTRNGKESFLMTNIGIHFLSERYQSGFIPYSDINDIYIQTKNMFPNLVINDQFILPMRFASDFVYELRDDLLNTIIPMLIKYNSSFCVE